jgi:hypothetical protein
VGRFLGTAPGFGGGTSPVGEICEGISLEVLQGLKPLRISGQCRG